MPVEVKRWACAFGCRKPAIKDRKRMERHERTCFSNPARRSCKTCRFEVTGREGRECDAPGERGHLGAEAESNWDRFGIAFGCQAWMGRDG